jgi:RNA-directed DNA polymerase
VDASDWKDADLRFTALLHHVSEALLSNSFYALKRKAAPGVDGLTWQEYETDLDKRLEDLHSRVHRATFQESLHSQAGWTTETPGGQNRPTCGGNGPQSDLRRGLLGVLLWFPTGARHA